MEREVFDDLWDKADREYRSQGNNSFTFKHHLFAVLDDKLKVQPKLSIPKKIAELVNTGDTEYIRWSFADDFIPGNDFVGTGDDWRDHENLEAEIVRRKALVSAYLAGKALGVEFVEVSGE